MWKISSCTDEDLCIHFMDRSKNHITDKTTAVRELLTAVCP